MDYSERTRLYYVELPKTGLTIAGPNPAALSNALRLLREGQIVLAVDRAIIEPAEYPEPETPPPPTRQHGRLL